MTTTRRQAAALLLALGASLATASSPAQEAVKEFRIGYQKGGLIVAARQRGLIEKRRAPEGVTVRWVEFQAGPLFQGR